MKPGATSLCRTKEDGEGKKVKLKEKKGLQCATPTSLVGLQEYSRHDQGPDHEAGCFLLAGLPLLPLQLCADLPREMQLIEVYSSSLLLPCSSLLKRLLPRNVESRHVVVHLLAHFRNSSVPIKEHKHPRAKVGDPIEAFRGCSSSE